MTHCLFKLTYHAQQENLCSFIILKNYDHKFYRIQDLWCVLSIEYKEESNFQMKKSLKHYATISVHFYKLLSKGVRLLDIYS